MAWMLSALEALIQSAAIETRRKLLASIQGVEVALRMLNNNPHVGNACLVANLAAFEPGTSFHETIAE